MNARLILSALLLGSCAPAAAPDDGASANGWTIAPNIDLGGGDLNAFFDCLSSEKIALVSAHRGGPAPGFPENALETLARALSLGPAILEIDVTQSADGVLFLLHDDRLERTTSGAGAASATAFAEIAKLRLKDPAGETTAFAPPRFEDVLAWAAPRTILQIDIKRAARYEAVAETIKSQGAEDRIILLAGATGQARKLHALLPGAMISLSLSSMSELNRAVASGVPADRLLGFTGSGTPRRRLFDSLASRDVEVVFATFDAEAAAGEAADYEEIAAMGADILASDRPEAAHAALLAAGRGAKDGICGIKGPSRRQPY